MKQERDQSTPDTQDPDISIHLIQDRYRHRVAAQDARKRIDSQTGAMVRRYLGYQNDLPEKETKRIAEVASETIKAIQKGTEVPEAGQVILDSPACVMFILAAKESRLPYINHERQCEKEMVSMAKKLPVYKWVESVKGLGAVGLAVLVGECGDLSKYANPAKLWKRLGLAVMDGRRQGDPGSNATAEDWIEHGYCKRRRSACWTIREPLLKNDNEYRTLLLTRKQFEYDKATKIGLVVATTSKKTADNWEKVGLPRPEVVKKVDTEIHRSVGHIHNLAARYVEKRMIRDLWRAWRDVA